MKRLRSHMKSDELTKADLEGIEAVLDEVDAREKNELCQTSPATLDLRAKGLASETNEYSPEIIREVNSLPG